MKPIFGSMMKAATAIILGTATAAAQSVQASADTYVIQDKPHENKGGAWEISVRSSGGIHHGFVRFDLSDIPQDSSVQAAAMRIWIKKVRHSGAIDFHLATGAWSEARLTHATVTATTPPFARVAISEESRKSYINIDLTDVARAWIEGDIENHGIALLPAPGTEVSVELESREGVAVRHRGAVFSILPGHPPELAVRLASNGVAAAPSAVEVGVAGKEGAGENGTSPGPSRRGTKARAWMRTAMIRPVPGDSRASGDALLRSLEQAEATANLPYAIRIEPGVYDLGTRSLVMKEHVNIRGAGEATTVITAVGQPSDGLGTVVGASNAELRSLSVRNQGGDGFCVAIFNGSASPTLHHVTVVAEPARAPGGDEMSHCYGIINLSSSPTMRDVTVTARGAHVNHGMFNFQSTPEMTNVTIGTAGGRSNFGMYNDSSSLRMIGVSVVAEGGSTENLAMAAFQGGRVRCTGCSLEGSTYSVLAPDELAVEFDQSKLMGAVSGRKLLCKEVYDEDSTLLAADCRSRAGTTRSAQEK